MRLLTRADRIALALLLPGALLSSAPRPTAGSVEAGSINPGTTLARDLCLTVALGDAAAAECGDLRLAHALPSARTLDRARTPVLLYNSQHARPYPLVAAHVTLGQGTTDLRRVEATLYVNGAPRAQRTYRADQWPDAGAARVVLGYGHDSREGSNWHAYRLRIVARYGAPGAPEESADTLSATGELVVVNRAHSPFGAGWWLAGYEQLRLDGQGRPALWVGGDGSTRRYTRVDSTRWIAPSLDRPDTLVLDTVENAFARLLPGGVRVLFDRQGRHVATVNRLGHRTRFEHDAGGYLQRLLLPVPEGAPERAYRFVYDESTRKLARVESPGAGEMPRVTRVFNSGLRVDSIEDPDAFRVRFAYDPTSPTRVTGRKNKRGHATTFAYDSAGKVQGSFLAMDVGEDIHWTLRAQESQGFAAPARADSAHTWLDGPREVSDTTRFWLGRWGEPDSLLDALGHKTVLARTDLRFPALVTEVRHPNGFVEHAAYTARGNLSTHTAVDPYLPQDTADAVTRYAYTDSLWPDFLTSVTQPEGEITELGYDATGNRVWQQVGASPDTTRRVRFSYNALGLLESILSPANRASGARDSLLYDGLGNLRKTQTPLGFLSLTFRDALGRDTLVLTPTSDAGGRDSAQVVTTGARQRMAYDEMDRVRESWSIGPAMNGAPAETLFVQSSFDAEGNLTIVTRWGQPNPTGIGALTTRWDYDRAGRDTLETAPDGQAERRRYDPAGNLVQRVTRRGHTVELAYDALDRLAQRILPSVSYAAEDDSIESQPFHFPQPALRDSAGGLTITGEVASFAYDARGNLIRADNGDARVRRSYHPNGQIAADTLWVRPYAGGFDSTTHVYVLRYGYDLDGRRAWMRHPASLAPRQGANGALLDYQGYRYHPTTGALDTVVNVLGHRYAFGHDLAGRVESLEMPGQVSRSWRYDGSDRVRFQETRAAKYAGGARLEFRTDTLHADTLARDARGKIVEALPVDPLKFRSAHNAYSGLGRLVRAENVYDEGDSEESWRYDPLGNVAVDSTDTDTYASEGVFEYDAASGRLEVRDGAGDLGDTLSYDAGGNLYRLARSYVGAVGEVIARERHYYDAAERLRVLDRRTLAYTGSPARDQDVYEEYRYDALGRRILLRSRYGGGCDFAALQCAIQRFVWDGSDLLYETRYPGGDGYVVYDQYLSYLEEDTAVVRQIRPDPKYEDAPADTSYYPYWGRVGYTHALGIDRPLDLVRQGFGRDSVLFDAYDGAMVVRPHENWRGEYDTGTFEDGLLQRQRRGVLFRPQWPAPHLDAYLQQRDGNTPVAWLGSLVENQRDASGLLYRRNRYYDPVTGRFTQEDPIGLAGGINLYGFADGDPVGYSDPFGLCPVCDIADIGFALWSTGKAIVSPTRENWRNAGLDAIGLLPFVPAAGMVRRVDSWIDAGKVRFSQSSASRTFSDGRTVDDLVAGLRSGTIDPATIPPIRLVERNGKLFSLDNRRLGAFQEAGSPVPYRMATPEEIAKDHWKFTTRNDGTSIRWRGQK